MDSTGTTTKSEYAAHRGVSPAMITRWRKASRIVMVGDRVDVAASDALLNDTLDPARGGHGGKSGRTPLPPQGQTAPSPDAYTRVRTFREGFAAKTAEAVYRKMIGELVAMPDVTRALFDCLGPALQLLDTVPARVIPRIVPDPVEARKAHALLASEIAAIRDQVADVGAALAKKLGAGRQQ